MTESTEFTLTEGTKLYRVEVTREATFFIEASTESEASDAAANLSSHDDVWDGSEIDSFCYPIWHGERPTKNDIVWRGGPEHGTWYMGDEPYP